MRAGRGRISGYSENAWAVTVTDIHEINSYCSRLLNTDQVKDYCPIGLQVENSGAVAHIVSSVTASEAAIQAAIAGQADALVVHHGYFWRGEPESLTGMKFRRIKALIDHNIALLAYHLPLDIDARFGNNALLGQKLQFVTEGSLSAGGTDNLFWFGRLETPATAQALSAHLTSTLGRAPIYAGPDDGLTQGKTGGDLIQTVGWCTGGAQQFVSLAADQGLDAYVSGEISEQTTHIARECGIHYFAAGHHATERYGVQALGEHLAEHFGLTHEFVDIDNPA